MGSSEFLQEIFNKISLQKNQKLWLSYDDSKTEERIKLLAQFEETKFYNQLSASSPFIRMCKKNTQISNALRVIIQYSVAK